MSAALCLCTSCNRHVRSSEAHCPFCSEKIATTLASTIVFPRLSRSLLVAMAATFGATHCASTREHAGPVVVPSTQALTDASEDAQTDAVVDAMEAGVDAALDAEQDEQAGVVAIYGSSTVMIVNEISFESANTRLRPEALPILDALVQTLRGNPQIAHVTVEGHRDNSARERGVRGLALRRAEVVRDYLVAHGIAAERLQAVSREDQQPIVPNTTGAGRTRNRRVSFRIDGQNP